MPRLLQIETWFFGIINVILEWNLRQTGPEFLPRGEKSLRRCLFRPFICPRRSLSVPMNVKDVVCLSFLSKLRQLSNTPRPPQWMSKTLSAWPYGTPRCWASVPDFLKDDFCPSLCLSKTSKTLSVCHFVTQDVGRQAPFFAKDNFCPSLCLSKTSKTLSVCPYGITRRWAGRPSLISSKTISARLFVFPRRQRSCLSVPISLKTLGVRPYFRQRQFLPVRLSIQDVFSPKRCLSVPMNVKYAFCPSLCYSKTMGVRPYFRQRRFLQFTLSFQNGFSLFFCLSLCLSPALISIHLCQSKMHRCSSNIF